MAEKAIAGNRACGLLSLLWVRVFFYHFPVSIM
jgi:hypothetical protein